MSQERFPQEYLGRTMNDDVKNVIRLTLAFTKAVNDHDDDENLVVSPYNAMMALSMAAMASDGNTKAEFTKVLFGDETVDLEEKAKAFMTLNQEILDANKDQVTISTANAFWLNRDQGMALNETFADHIKSIFDAEISEDAFSDPATIDKVNQWASDNTNKLIPEIVQQGSLTPDMLALLASSLYFKGDWTEEFDKKLTTDKPFTRDDQTQEQTQMMMQYFDEDTITYQEGDDYEAATMTYGKNDPDNRVVPTMRIILIRPSDDNVSAREWLAGHDESKFPAWMDPYAYEPAVGKIELPHIDTKTSYDIKGVLQDMGLTDAFDSRADFSPMTADGNNNIYINKAQHDVVFKSDEKGSEAAAVTQIGFAMECAMPSPRNIDLQLNRSFVLAVQDVRTGAPLFIGAIDKPNPKMKP